jgi:hypothetical protein
VRTVNVVMIGAAVLGAARVTMEMTKGKKGQSKRE